jgi:hypothetical protein
MTPSSIIVYTTITIFVHQACETKTFIVFSRGNKEGERERRKEKK